MQIHYSLQPNVQGRPAKGQADTTNPIHYKQGFHSKYTTVEEFAKAIAEDGYLWSGTTFRQGVRTGGNFQLADTFSLDFDNQQQGTPTRVEDVLQHHPLTDGIAVIYYTGSSTKERPRFRVVFRLDKPIRDRREYRLFCHRLHAVSADRFDGLDNTNDEARIWYGNTKGVAHLNSSARVDLDQLQALFGDLDEEIQRNAENAAIRRVATRSELVKLGLMEEKDAFAGDPETDIEIFKLCLQHLPKWKGNGTGWYADNSWILGAAVESFGVDIAAEVLESVWGGWPRDRHLYEELQQWERNHGNPAGFGSVVFAALAAPTWTDEDQNKLDELQKQGAERSGFFARHQDTLNLESIQELFGCAPVTSSDDLAKKLAAMTTDERLQAVDSAIVELLSDRAIKRAWRTPKSRKVNEFFGSPYESREIPTVIKRLKGESDRRNLKGAKPLHDIEDILSCAEEATKTGGYIVENLIPAQAFNILIGAPKAGKTSLVICVLINALLGLAGSRGLESVPFTSLIIFSDDQSITVTSSFIQAAIKGSGLTKEQAVAKLKGKIHIFPRLTLDEDGIEQVSSIVEQNLGSVVVIDSLKSVSGRLGVDENSHEMGDVVSELRDCIQMIDPTSTTVLIHHSGKGGSSGRSMSDVGRGSNSIPAATDNQIYIERPTAKVNGKEREVDVSTERVITMRGRTIPESKIVVSGQFDFDNKGLVSSSVSFISDFATYEAQKQDNREKPKTRLELLTTPEYTIYSAFQHCNQLSQSELMNATSFNQGQVSKALTELLAEPPLIEQAEKVNGKKTYRRHSKYLENGVFVYHLQG